MVKPLKTWLYRGALWRGQKQKNLRPSGEALSLLPVANQNSPADAVMMQPAEKWDSSNIAVRAARVSGVALHLGAALGRGGLLVEASGAGCVTIAQAIADGGINLSCALAPVVGRKNAAVFSFESDRFKCFCDLR